MELKVLLALALVAAVTTVLGLLLVRKIERRRIRQGQRGFSLIEVLFVLAIVLVLTAIFLPLAVNHAAKDAKSPPAATEPVRR